MDPIDPNAPPPRRTLAAVALQRTSGATWVRVVFVGGVAIAGLVGTQAASQRDDEHRYEGPGACALLDGIDPALVAAAVPPAEGSDVAALVDDEVGIGETQQGSGAPAIVRAEDDDLVVGSGCTISRARGSRPTLRLVVVNAAFDGPGGVHGAAVAPMRLDPGSEELRSDDGRRFESTVEGGCTVTVPATSPDDEVVVSVSLEGDGGCAAVDPVLDAVVAEVAG